MDFAISYGNQSFKKSSARLSAYELIAKNGRYHVNRKVMVGDSFERQGSPIVEYASRENVSLNGQWFYDQYIARQNALLMLQYRATIRTSPFCDAVCFLVMRKSASLIKVEARLPSHHNARFDSRIAFMGRAHRVSHDELEDLGVEYPKKFADCYMDEQEFDEAYSIEEVAAGAESRIHIEKVSKSGVTKSVITAERKRRIRLRRTEGK